MPVGFAFLWEEAKTSGLAFDIFTVQCAGRKISHDLQSVVSVVIAVFVVVVLVVVVDDVVVVVIVVLVVVVLLLLHLLFVVKFSHHL